MPILNTKWLIYRVSVRSLFILAILAETERSMVRLPISTTNPPIISGLTCAHVRISLGQHAAMIQPYPYLVGNLQLLALTDV